MVMIMVGVDVVFMTIVSVDLFRLRLMPQPLIPQSVRACTFVRYNSCLQSKMYAKYLEHNFEFEDLYILVYSFSMFKLSCM